MLHHQSQLAWVHRTTRPWAAWLLECVLRSSSGMRGGSQGAQTHQTAGLDKSTMCARPTQWQPAFALCRRHPPCSSLQGTSNPIWTLRGKESKVSGHAIPCGSLSSRGFLLTAGGMCKVVGFKKGRVGCARVLSSLLVLPCCGLAMNWAQLANQPNRALAVVHDVR